MAINLGTAYVDIVPATGNLASALRGQVEGPLGESGRTGGRMFGSNFMSAVTSQMDSLGSGVVDRISTWATRGTMAASAVIGVGLYGGIQRALDREEAVVTFRRLGLDDLGITNLTDLIDAALRGTPVTNPQGFQLAGQFLAQGFDAADIPGVISSIADMAKVGNRSFEEMADVMVRAAGQGRFTAAELNRLGTIPLGRIAEEIGLGEAALRDLVSTGGLSADMFLEAFTAIEEFSGAAKDPTTRVAFSNLRTAIASLGESFVGPLFGENGPMQQWLLSLRDYLSAVGPAVKDFGQRFSDWLIPAVRSAGEWFESSLVPALRSASGWMSANREQIGRWVRALVPAAGAIAGIATAFTLVNRAMALTPIGAVLTLATGLVYAYQNSETFRDIVTRAFDAVTRAVGPVVDTVMRISTALRDAFSSDGVGGLLRELGRTLGAIGTWILDVGLPALVSNLAKWGSALIGWIGPKIPPLLVELGKLIAELGKWIITDAYPKIVTKLAEWAAAFVGWVGTAGVELLWALTQWWFNDAVPWFAALPGRIIKAIGDLAGKMWAAGKEAGESLIKGMEGALASAAKDNPFYGALLLAKRGYGPMGWISAIPGFDSGGVVPGRRGEPVLALVHGGETVLPTHKPGWDVQPPATAGVTFHNEINTNDLDPNTALDLLNRYQGWQMAQLGIG